MGKLHKRDRDSIYSMLATERNLTKEEAVLVFQQMYRSEKVKTIRRALSEHRE